jgi:neprosin-like protein
MPAPLSFDDFREQLSRARAEDFGARPVGLAAPVAARAAVDDATAAFDRWKESTLAGYGPAVVDRTFVDAGDLPVDCIKLETQPGLAGATRPAVAKPPAFDGSPARRRSVPAQLGEGRTDRYGVEAYCPPGFVPVLRPSLDRVHSAGGPVVFYRKAPDGGQHPSLGNGRDAIPAGTARAMAAEDLPLPRIPVGSATHLYAHAFQDVPNVGGQSWLNLWNPDPAPGVFSLSQQWWTAGSGPGLQTVESGWHVYPQMYGGDRATRLFIFFTNNGYQVDATGWPTGSAYNLNQVPGLGGFVQTDNTWVIGGSFTASQPGGDQQGFRMAWRLDAATGNWWLYLQAGGDAVPVGYYPGAVFRGGLLTRGAARIDFGGEMCSQNNGRQTGQMGSGRPASAGWQYAAYQGEIAYVPAGGGALAPATLIADQQDAPAYTIDLHNNQGGQTYFYFGGPGAQW